ncbi:hypothetical protein Hden_1201 [Hyphomicrobium denitrificans ATCC 51888]|uniref:Uncharacterized protein n=1 Tax=Hyphomicrobium denitrificans (strain ATCC 51888 / DSM 1869 / NCIMB 11706 / TK 0415) TaxID=582899 RepID=D8JWA1_HYPDA|nr:hypothetical protein [Hyphomicrobium denitrificans]ADJ23014.1 hypothetical protein Hden_1201 [Hyphomicrobium denitrificans ATCC 51888]
MTAIKDEQQQREEHDRDLAVRVATLILDEDVIVSRLNAENKSRMVDRMIAAMGIARMHERAIKAGPVIDALNEARRMIENYQNAK